MNAMADIIPLYSISMSPMLVSCLNWNPVKLWKTGKARGFPIPQVFIENTLILREGWNSLTRITTASVSAVHVHQTPF